VPNDAGLLAFIGGYGIKESEWNDVRERATQVLFLSTIDGLRWCVDWAQEKLPTRIAEMKTLIERGIW
jgi:hypothetical protein